MDFAGKMMSLLLIYFLVLITVFFFSGDTSFISWLESFCEVLYIFRQVVHVIAPLSSPSIQLWSDEIIFHDLYFWKLSFLATLSLPFHLHRAKVFLCLFTFCHWRDISMTQLLIFPPASHDSRSNSSSPKHFIWCMPHISKARVMQEENMCDLRILPDFVQSIVLASA